MPLAGGRDQATPACAPFQPSVTDATGLLPLTLRRSARTAALSLDFGALLSGALAPLAFAPLSLFPLAVLGPALLFALWLRSSPSRAAWRGWLFGLGMFGVGVSWVQVSIYNYGGVGLPTALAITGLLVAILAAYPAAMGYLVGRLYPSTGAIKAVLVLPAAWVLFEWLRGWLFTGFPWLSLGYSQTDTWLAGLAPIVGVYGVSWATVLSAGLLLQAARAGSGRRRVLLVLVLAAVWAAGWALGRLEWTQPHGHPLKVSLVQGDVEQGIKWLPGERLATLERYARMTAEHWGSDVVIWPETAIPMFYHQVPREFLAQLLEQARAHGTDLLVGAPVLNPATSSYYNSLLKLGDPAGVYHKHHLVPFTEYLPLKQWLGGAVDLLDVPMSDFSPGAAAQPPLKVGGVPVGASICYEIAFGEEIIRALPAASLLVNVSNDAWFGRSLAPYQHLQIARMRTLETGRPLLRATNTGITAIIDEHGRLMATLPMFQAGVLTGTVQPRTGLTPYAAAGNLLMLLLVAVLLTLGAAVYGWQGRGRGVRGNPTQALLSNYYSAAARLQSSVAPHRQQPYLVRRPSDKSSFTSGCASVK